MMRAKVIAPKETLPFMAQFYAGKIGEIVDMPDSRSPVLCWLKFANGKIAWFHKDEIQLLTDDDPPPPVILVPIGQDNGASPPPNVVVDGVIAWLKILNPEANCEVNYNDS